VRARVEQALEGRSGPEADTLRIILRRERPGAS
ncbi:translation initiation factor 2, partial [Muribaculaceae bacterium Isolate-002 (NCI)]